MISDLNRLCYHHYIYVLDPIVRSHMHLLRVMIRKPHSDNIWDTFW